ncbi:MAG: hypothetical protein PHR56_06850 [Dehalococcoidales bacterium]|nr:hypothetical protein [Dehalococcoidales bacterium]
MTREDFVKSYIIEVLYASAIEMANDEGAACIKARLRSQFMNMSNAELWELAQMTSFPPKRPVEMVYLNYIQSRDKLKGSAEEDSLNIICKKRLENS